MTTNIKQTPIEGLPSNSEIVSNLNSLEQKLNVLEPLLNKANQAFGGQAEVLASVTDLRNRISKAKAVYQA